MLAFLPLVKRGAGDEDGAMDPFLVTELAEAHRRDLVDLAQAEHATRRARRARGDVAAWRRAIGGMLVAVGVGVGLPRQRRDPALRQALSLIADDCRC